MITDKDTNYVYLSSLIQERPELRSFWLYLEKTLRRAGIGYGLIENTRDLWCRDYMPVQVAKRDYVQFTFDPSYYKGGKWEHLLTDTEKVEVAAAPHASLRRSPLVLDGGNLIRSQNTVVLTERLLKENAMPREDVIVHLRRMLQVEHVHLIPSLPYEVSGHADGMVRLLDDHTLLVADYHCESPSWKARYERALRNTGLHLMPFPGVMTEVRNKEREYSALGCYINFAWIGDVVLFPQFDLPEDKEALKEAKRILKGNKVLAVPAAELAMYCGVLNCATWNVLV